MNYRIVLLVALTCILSSCATESTYFIRFDITGGILKEAPVVIKGHNVGMVKNIILDQRDNVILEISVDPEISLPVNSEFLNENLSLLGDRGININLGSSQNFINEGDTVNGKYVPNKVWEEVKSGASTLMDSFNEYTAKQDSILIELQKLNEKVDRLHSGQ